MKSMEKIVNSIKNDRLRNVATELMEKLENVKVAIQEKRSRGEAVSGLEEAELKKSLSNYVKKGLSVALVSAMLASCLAGCEIGKTGENGGKIDGNKVTSSGSTSSTKNPASGNLVIVPQKEFSVNIDSSDLGLFGLFDLNTILTDDSSYKELLKKDSYYRQENDSYFYEDAVPLITSGIVHLLEKDRYWGETIILQRDDEKGWRHYFFSTENKLAIISADKSGKPYITGLTDGTLRNDLGLISQKDIETFESMAEEMTYGEILTFARNNFYGEMYKHWLDGKITFDYYMYYSHEDGMPYANQRNYFKNIHLTNGDHRFDWIGIDSLAISDFTFNSYWKNMCEEYYGEDYSQNDAN